MRIVWVQSSEQNSTGCAFCGWQFTQCKCGFKAQNQAQLDVYFIDGNLRNTATSNLKTVCANCQRLQGVRRLGWRVGDLVADN